MVKKFKEISGKRTFLGQLSKWTFWGFNILMAVWLIGGMSSASKEIDKLGGAEAAGAAIGTGIGAIMILMIWVFGDIILGMFYFFTRPAKTIVEDE